MTKYIKIAVYDKYGYLIPRYLEDYSIKYNYDNFDDIWDYIYGITGNKQKKIIKLYLYYSDKWEPIMIININENMKIIEYNRINDSDNGVSIIVGDIEVISIKDVYDDANYMAFIENVKEYIRLK